MGTSALQLWILITMDSILYACNYAEWTWKRISSVATGRRTFRIFCLLRSVKPIADGK